MIELQFQFLEGLIYLPLIKCLVMALCVLLQLEVGYKCVVFGNKAFQIFLR